MEIDISHIHIANCYCTETDSSLVRVAKADSFIISGAAISGATEDGDSSFVSGRGVEIEGCVRGSVTNSKFTGLVVKCTGFSGGSYEEAGGGGLKATVKATGVTGRSMEKSGNGDASDIRTEEEEAQLAIEGCQFERCKVIGAGKEKALLVGGGVWCVLGKKDDGAGEGGRIEIKGCMFKSCWAGEKKDETGMAEDANNTEGRGGGIFLDVQNTNMKFYLGGVTKENEEGDTEGPMAGKKNLFGVGERDECYALHGRNLFVRYPVANASEIVEKIRFDFEYDTESAKGRHEMEGGYFREDTEGEGEKTIREETESLLRYLVDWDESEGAYVMMGKKEKEIEVGGEDVLGCGRKYLPCVKIDYAYENAGWDVSSDEAKIVLSGANYAIKAPIELLAGNGANGALPGKVIIDGAAGSEDGSAEKMKVMIDIESKPGVSGRNEGEEGDAKGAITSHVNLVIQNVYFSLNKAGNKSSSVVWSEGAGVSLSVEHVEFDGAEISEETIGWRVIHYEGGSNLSMSDVTVKAMKLSKSMIEYEYGVSSQVAEGGGEGGGEVANKVNLVDVWMNDCKVNGGNGGKAYLVKVEAGEGVSVNMEEVTITKSVSEEGCGSLVRVAKADSFIISGAAISGATEDGDSSFVSGRGVEIEGCVRGSVTNSKFTGLVVKCTGFSGGSYEEAGGGGLKFILNTRKTNMKLMKKFVNINNNVINMKEEFEQLIIEDCLFENCEAIDFDEGNIVLVGGGFFCRISEEESCYNSFGNADNYKLLFSNLIFKKCRLLKDGSKGGGMYVHNLENLPMKMDMRVSDMNNCIDNKAIFGSVMFLYAKDLSEIVKSTTFNFLASGANIDEFLGSELINDPDVDAVPLFAFTLGTFSNSSIDDNGIDNYICGYQKYPCATISQAIERAKTSYSKRICKILNKSSVEKRISLNCQDYQISIEGTDKSKSTLTTKDGTAFQGNSAFEIITKISFKTLRILLKRHGSINSFTTVNGGNLEYGSCSISNNATRESLNYPFLNMINGNVSFSYVSLSDLNYQDASFMIAGYENQQKYETIRISLSYSNISKSNANGCDGFLQVVNIRSFTVNRCNFNNVNLSCPLIAMNYISAGSVSYSNFTQIKSSGTHGGCIAMKKLNDNQQDQSLNFSQVRFSNVNVDGSESQGGSMYLALDNKMKLLINNSAFSSSSANLSNGRGGALLLNLLPPFVGSYLLSSPTFKFNSAKCGRDVFVYATRLSTGAVMSWFDFSFFDGYDQKNALYGADALDSKDVNLFDLWEQKSSVVVIADDGIDSKLCGTTSIPCKSFSDALSRLEGDDKYIQIDGKCYITSSNDVSGTTIQPHNEDSSQSPGTKQITLVLKGNESIEITTGLLCNSKFFALQNASLHITRELACGAVIKSTEGHAHLTSIELTYEEADQTANALLKRSTNDPFQIAMNILLIEGGDLTISEFRMNGLAFAVSPIVLNQNCGNISISSMTVDDTIINDIESSFYSIADPNERYNSDEKINFSLSHSSFSNLSRGLSVESLAKLKSVSQCFPLIYSQFDDLPLIGNPQADIFEKCPTIDIGNCSFNCFEDNCNAPFIGISKSVTSISFSTFNAGLFSNSNSRLLCDKSLNELNSFSELQSNASINNNPEQFSSIEDICGWNGSMMELKKSEVFMKETAFINGKNGGLSVVGGKVRIEMGIYSDNNPKIEKYESLRRNIICKNAAELELVSLKDGDGLKDDSSLWILNEGCTLGGIAGKRASPLFTPHLESVTASSQGQDAQIELKGKLLIPCNLSLQFTLNRSDGHHIVKEILEKEYSIDEKNIRLTVQLSSLGWDEKTTEASVCVLFGNAESPSETISFILQNSTEANSEISNNETESPKKGKLEWSIIAFIACVVIIVIMIIAFIILAVLYRKKQSISKMPFIEIDSEKVKLEEAEEMKREDSKITKETNDISSTLLEKKQSQGPQRIGINDISIPIEPENFCIETIQQVDGFDKSMPADSVISIIDSPFPVISDEIMHLVIDSSPSPSQKKRGKKRGKKREKGKLRKGKKAKSLQKKVEDIESVEDDNCFSEETNGPQ